ncbi:MAG: ankyrin repeat domain-containing protein [Bacteroidota bacterium]
MIRQLIYEGNLQKLKEIAANEGIEAVKCNDDPHELAAIHWAANAGNLDIVRFYLQPPISENPSLVRNNNFSPLHAASMVGHTEVVRLLIENGADVNVQTDPQKYAPIHSACFGGHLETIKLLIENGASIALRNYRNELPIETAIRQNQTVVIEYLADL